MKIATAFRLSLLLFLLVIPACNNKPIGTPCVRKGDGFTARHHCETLCMSIWKITCADGTKGNSNVCGGELNCSRGSCPTDQVCYQTNMDRSVCIPANICPEWKDPATHPEVHLKTLSSRKSQKTTSPAPPAG